MAVYDTHSKEETVQLGRRLAGTLRGGELILFTGGLGAGKTAFCQGLAQGLGCTDPVSSPTFSIVNYYRGPIPLAHFDLYRVSDVYKRQPWEQASLWNSKHSTLLKHSFS